MAPSKLLRICHVNIRSISAPSRLLDLEILSASHHLDILCISETWLSSTKRSSDILLPGFQPPFRRDRPTSTGGGVAAYIKEGLSVTPILLPPHLNNSIECLCLKVHLTRRTKVNVVVTYRPPGSKADSYFMQLDAITDFIQKNNHTALCIVGDFNAKVSKWLSSQATDSAGKLAQFLAASHNLTQVVTEPTYGLTSTSPSLLDLIFINKPHLVRSCTVLPPIADHCPTVVHLQLLGAAKLKPSRRSTWDFEHADLCGLRSQLSSMDWSPLSASGDVNSAVALWSSTLLSCAQKFIPMKHQCVRPRSKPWYSPYLHKLAKLRDRLFKRCKGLSPTSPLYIAYKNVRNWYVSELRKAEHRFYRSLFYKHSNCPSSSSSHRWWSSLKSAVHWSTRESIPSLSMGGSLFLSPREKAEVFNTVFSKQCSATRVSANPDLPSSADKFTFSPLSVDDVHSALSSLKIWKAPGLDGVSNRLLRECAQEISSPLCTIFNLSLSSGVFPSQWKAAKIIPIFKNKGERSLPSNYRPVALLSSVSKVFEGLIKKQLVEFCLSSNVIPDCQFGFLQGRSTTWQLLSVLNDWHNALDTGHTIHALFLDVSKAFDRVDHALLIARCRSIGICNASLQWIESYLSGRSIVSCVDGELSQQLPVSSGVPQGSVLGPLFFLVFFSTLPAAIKESTAVSFADDTLIYNVNCQKTCNLDQVCCPLQSDVNELSFWADRWNTKFNPTKSAQMLISRSSGTVHQMPCAINGERVPQSDHVQHLGVSLSSSLSWSDHVHNVIRKAGWKVALLKRLAFRCRIPIPVFSLLFKTLVRPCLEYASCSWDNCTKSDIYSLERLQLSLAKAILSAHLGSFCVSQFSKSQLLSFLGWPTLSWRRRRQKLLLFWQLKNGLGPPSLTASLPSAISTRCSYSLRSAHSSQVPRCSSSAHLSSFIPSACILWNSLSPEITSATSASSFSRHLDNFYLSDTFSFGLPPA